MGRNLIVVILLFTTLQSHTLFAQKEYFDEVLKIIELNSIKRDSIDFDKLKDNVYQRLKNIKSIKEYYPIVRFILAELNDHHSFFMEKEEVDKWMSTSKSNDFKKSPPPYIGKILYNKIGYVQMQGFSSGDSISIQEYATELQNLIKSIDSKRIKGWILDLRLNTGGNCWPMLVGIGPLLGNGICGYFIDNNGNKSNWYYKDGEAGTQIPLCKMKDAPYKLFKEKNPIAVLTGSWTASSGEVIATSFKGKPNAKSFGENTAGLSTGNTNYKLSDGSMLFLTTTIFADRNGNSYGGKIKPDIYQQSENTDKYSENDPLLKRAFDWIINSK
jgi:carboxyl-terminal processing protease